MLLGFRFAGKSGRFSAGFVCLLPSKCLSSGEQSRPCAQNRCRHPTWRRQASALASRAAGPPPLPGILPRAQVPPPAEAVPLSRPSGTRRRLSEADVMAAEEDVFQRARGRTLTAFRQGTRNYSGGLHVPAGSILCPAARRAGPRWGAESSEAATAAAGCPPSGRGTSEMRRGPEVRGGQRRAAPRAVGGGLYAALLSAGGGGGCAAAGKRPTTSDARSRMNGGFSICAAELELRKL